MEFGQGVSVPMPTRPKESTTSCALMFVATIAKEIMIKIFFIVFQIKFLAAKLSGFAVPSK